MTDTRPSFLGDIQKQLRQIRDELRRTVRRYEQTREPEHPKEGDLWIPAKGTLFVRRYLNGAWHDATLT